MRWLSKGDPERVGLVEQEILDAVHAADKAIAQFAESQGIERSAVPPEIARRVYDEHLAGVAGWLAGSDT
jgi:hypothetical protein